MTFPWENFGVIAEDCWIDNKYIMHLSLQNTRDNIITSTLSAWVTEYEQDLSNQTCAANVKRALDWRI